MLFFKILGAGLGLLMLFFDILFVANPAGIKSWIKNKILPAVKPVWINPVALLMFIGSGVLIWWSLQWGVSFHTAIVAVFLLSALKMMLFAAKYEAMRKLSIEMMDREVGALKIMLLANAAVAIGLIILAGVITV